MSRPTDTVESAHARRTARKLRELANHVERNGMIGVTVGLIDARRDVHVVLGGYAEQAKAHALHAALKVWTTILSDEDL